MSNYETDPRVLYTEFVSKAVECATQCMLAKDKGNIYALLDIANYCWFLWYRLMEEK